MSRSERAPIRASAPPLYTSNSEALPTYEQVGSRPAYPPTFYVDTEMSRSSLAPFSTQTSTEKELLFSDSSIRAGFIRKVFALLFVQLLIVISITLVFRFDMDLQLFVQKNQWLYFLSYVTFIVVYMSLICSEGLRRKFPLNLILLLLLTLAISYVTAMLTSMYSTDIVLLAMGLCAAITIGIVTFSLFTKWDFTLHIGVIVTISLGVVIFGLFTTLFTIFFNIPALNMLYAGLVAFLFMVYLMIDLQMLLGGRQLELSPEEYVFASLQLFLDIVYLFWMLLLLARGVDSRN